MIQPTPKPLRLFKTSLLTVALATLTGHASGAMGQDDEWQVNTTLTVNYGVNYRLNDPAKELIDFMANPVTAIMDDGNRNFKKGIVSNRLSLLGELDIYRGNTGFFARATGFYDQAYQGTNDNDSPLTVNKSGAHNKFNKDTEDYMGQRIRLLDAYVYTVLPMNDTSDLSLRFGNQVVQWGESMFFPNIAGAQSPVDANKANLPGISVKDILLPVPQFSFQWALNTDVTVMGYYQFRWEETEIPPVGSFFSYTDIIGPGAEFLPVAPGVSFPRVADDKPDDDSQGGMGVQWRITDNTELGFYQINYHDKTPMLEIAALDYRFKYYEDISLTGISATTQINGINIAGELTYRRKHPLLAQSPFGRFATTGDVWQAQANFLYVLGPNFLSESTSLVGEIVHIEANIDGNLELFGDESAAAVQLSVTPSYPSLIQGWAINVPINVTVMVDGDMPPTPSLGVLVSEDDIRFSIGANFTYLGNLEIGALYSAVLGSPDAAKNPLADRDYVAFNVKYSM